MVAGRLSRSVKTRRALPVGAISGNDKKKKADLMRIQAGVLRRELASVKLTHYAHRR